MNNMHSKLPIHLQNMIHKDNQEMQCLSILEGHEKEIVCLATYQEVDNWRLVTGSQDGTIGVWDLLTGERLHLLVENTGSIEKVTVYNDAGRWKLIALSGVLNFGDPTVHVWDLSTGKCLHVLQGSTGSIYSMSIYKDHEGWKAITGCDCAGANDICPLQIWDLSSGKCTKVLAQDADTGSPHYITTYHDDQGWKALIAYDNYDNEEVYIWDLVIGKCIQKLEGHKNTIKSIATYRDSHGWKAITGSNDYTGRLWDISTGECLHILKGHTDQVNHVLAYQNESGWKVLSVSGNNPQDYFQSAVGDSDSTVRIWNASTGVCLKSLNGHRDMVYCTSMYEGNGQRKIVTCSRDQSVCIWDLPTEKLDCTIDNPECPTCVSTHMDVKGLKVIIGCKDGSVRVWGYGPGIFEKLFNQNSTKQNVDDHKKQ